jgi:hypothetical protein
MTSTCSVCGRRFTLTRHQLSPAQDHVCSRPACRKAIAKKSFGKMQPKRESDDPLYVEAPNGMWNRI